MKRLAVAATSAAIFVGATTPAQAGEWRQKYLSLYNEVEQATGNIRGKPILHESPSKERLKASIWKIRSIRDARFRVIAAQRAAAAERVTSSSSSSDGGSSTTTASTTGGGGGNLPPNSIAECESGNDYGAVNPSSGAGGRWQILPSTWRSLGYSGSPQDAPPAVQDEAAAKLWNGGAGRSNWVC